MNLRQQLFVTYYTEGETKGNCEQSMLKAGYKSQYARGHCGTFIVANSCVKQAIEDRIKDINEYKNLKIEVVGANFLEDRRLAKQKGHIGEMISADLNLGKHVGFYALDNAQRTEQAKLTEQQTKEAKEYAKWRLLRGLEEPKQEAG